MDRTFSKETAREGAGTSTPSESWLFAQALLGKGVRSASSAAADERAKREQLAWLASISTEHESQLRRSLKAESDVTADRAQLEWLAGISPRHERQLRRLLATEAEAREVQRQLERFVEGSTLLEFQWDPSKHPRRGGPPNAGWFATTGGAGGSASAGSSTSFFDAVIRRNSAVADLTGAMTPGMVRSNRLATDLDSAARLPGEVAPAAAAGLGTGAKAVVNASATAIKNVATLGLSSSQLELIGVTKEDRERGYDNAVTIATASGEVLIAVGTVGIASALGKGGTVARAASGALVAYDAAGNTVGVVQGTYDASQNGVTLSNGAQVAGGALGISANVSAVKNLTTPRSPVPASVAASVPNTGFRVGKHGDMPSPRPGQHSHHGVMSAWMEKAYSGYDAKRAPAVLMPTTNHHATFGVYRKWRAEMAKKMDGTFDWSKVSEADMRELSEKMFDAAGVPASIRDEYWAQFERTKAAPRRQPPPPHSLESRLWGEQVMSENVNVLSAEEMQQRYGSFYKTSPMARLDRGKVPEQFWPLLPYAEFWGIADDWTREGLVKQAPPDVRQNLKQVVAAFDNALDEWLAGPEADSPSPTDEYIAFCAMGMAADYA